MAIDFRDQIVAGTVLVRQLISSQDYVQGVSGWAIYSNGDAEFNGVLVRGLFKTGDSPDARIEIDSTDGEGLPSSGQIRFYTGLPGETGYQAAKIELSTSVTEGALWTFQSSTYYGAFPAILSLDQALDGSTSIGLVADYISVSTPLTYDFSWTALTRVNSWGVLNSMTPSYFKDAAGTVHVRGRTSAGTAGLIGNLPVGYRPTENTDYALKSNNDGGSVSWVQMNTNGNITVLGNLALAQTWLALIFSFPTL